MPKLTAATLAGLALTAAPALAATDEATVATALPAPHVELVSAAKHGRTVRACADVRWPPAGGEGRASTTPRRRARSRASCASSTSRAFAGS